MAQRQLSKFEEFFMSPTEVQEWEANQMALDQERGTTDAVEKARQLLRQREKAQGDLRGREQLDALASTGLNFDQMQTSEAGPQTQISDAPTLQGQETAQELQRLEQLAAMDPDVMRQKQGLAGMDDRAIMEQQGLAPGGRYGQTEAAQAFREDLTGDVGMFEARQQELAATEAQQTFQQKINRAKTYLEFAQQQDPKMAAALEYAIDTASPGSTKLVDEMIKNFDGAMQNKQNREMDNQSKLTGEEQSLRQQYIGLSKDFKSIEDAYKRIEKAGQNPSAAGDLALIFNFMKLLDPGSTVREKEFATAENSGGVGDRFRNMYNRLLSGERLALNRKDFLERASMLFQSQAQQQENINQRFFDIAQRAGMNPKNIILFGSAPSQQQPQRQAPAGPPQVQQQGYGGSSEYDDIVRKYGAMQ